MQGYVLLSVNSIQLQCRHISLERHANDAYHTESQIVYPGKYKASCMVKVCSHDRMKKSHVWLFDHGPLVENCCNQLYYVLDVTLHKSLCCPVSSVGRAWDSYMFANCLGHPRVVGSSPTSGANIFLQNITKLSV